jgi:hypothetical protein
MSGFQPRADVKLVERIVLVGDGLVVVMDITAA